MTLHGRFTTGNIVGHQLLPPWQHLWCRAVVWLENRDTGSLHHTITEQSLWFGSVQDLTSVQLRQCQHMIEDVGQSEAENTKNSKVWLCWSLECLIVGPASNPDGCLIRPEESSWNPKSDSEAWEQSRKWRPVSLIKTTMHFNSVVIKF